MEAPARRAPASRPVARSTAFLQVPPRLLLDAILWKLATGQNWDDLPQEFPPMRICRKYYRRLFLSGRFYTLMLALYNHMCFEQGVDPFILLQDGLFITTPSQHIALVPGAPQTSANYTVLLFMQLARFAYSHFDRLRKQAHPLRPLLPLFKGEASLSTGLLPSEKPPQLEPAFQPIEESLFAEGRRRSERTRTAIDREVARRIRAGTPCPGSKKG